MRPDFTAVFIVLAVLLVLFMVALGVGLWLTRRARAARRLLEPPPGDFFPPTNTLAIAGFIAAFVAPVAAIPLGHIALVTLKRTRESGWGFAVAALWLGYAGVFFVAAYLALWFSFVLPMILSAPRP